MKNRSKLILFFFLFLSAAILFSPFLVEAWSEILEESWWRFDSAGSTVKTAISGDGNYIVASSDKLYLFKRDSNSPLWHYEVTGSVAISKDGSFIAVGSPEDHHVYLFSKDYGDPLEPLWSFDTGNDVKWVDISADGTHIVAGTSVTQSGQPNIFLFNKDTGTPLWSTAIGMEVEALDISKDGGTIAAAVSGWPLDSDRVNLFSKESEEPLWWADIDNPTAVALSADGGFMATGDWSFNVKLFSRESSEPLWVHNTGKYVYDVDISDDGEYIAAASGGVVLFSQESNVPLWTYEANYTEHVAISSDGRFIAVAGDTFVQKAFLFSRESEIPLWNHDTGTWLNSLALSANGGQIVAGDRDNGYVYFFPTSDIISGDAFRYTFTKIADSNGLFASFSNTPTINGDGTVVFFASLDDGDSGIYVGNGVGTSTIVDSKGDFGNFGQNPSINDSGIVVFRAENMSGEKGIYSVTDGFIAPIVTSARYFNNFSESPMINDIGTVTFWGSFGSGPMNVDGLFRAQHGFIRGNNLVSGSSSINNDGVVVFRGSLSSIGNGIFSEKDGIIHTIADTAGDFSGFTLGYPSINDDGTVVFRATLDTGGEGIYTAKDGVLTKITDTHDFAISSFEGDPLINDSEIVVFMTYQGDAIFSGADLIRDKVIGRDDGFGDRAVQRVWLGDINNRGQIAFHAEFKDGGKGIFRADPVKKIDPSRKGDLNQDGELGLKDAIAAMQVMTGQSEALSLSVSNEVSGDDRIGLAEATYPLMAIAGLLNHPPVIQPLQGKVIDESQEVSFYISASDDENDKLSYSASNLPEGARLNKATGSFTWTPSYAQAGSYSVHFVVTDPYGASDSIMVPITVNDRIPVLKGQEYFPASVGNYWDHMDHVSAERESVSISGTQMVHGFQAYIFEYQSGSREFYSLDAGGLRIHGVYLEEPEYTGYVFFDNPLLIMPSSAQIGNQQTSTSSYSLNIMGQIFHVDVTSTYQVVGLEDVSTENGVLKDCFKVSGRLVQKIRETGETVDTGIDYQWLYKGVGVVKTSDSESDMTILMSVVGDQVTLY